MTNPSPTSKEDILRQYRDDSKFPNFNKVVYLETDVKEAMDEYSKQQAIAFDEWKAKNGYRALLDSTPRYAQFENGCCCSDYFTTEQLYEMFLQS